MEDKNLFLLSITFVGFLFFTGKANARCDFEAAANCIPDIAFDEQDHCIDGTLKTSISEPLQSCMEENLNTCDVTTDYRRLQDEGLQFLKDLGEQCQYSANCTYICSVEYLTSQKLLVQPEPEPNPINRNEHISLFAWNFKTEDTPANTLSKQQNQSPKSRRDVTSQLRHRERRYGNEVDEEWEDNELLYSEMTSDFIDPFEAPNAEEQQLFCDNLEDVTFDDVQGCIAGHSRCTEDRLKQEILQRFHFVRELCEEGCENYKEREEEMHEECTFDTISEVTYNMTQLFAGGFNMSHECGLWQNWIDCVSDEIGSCKIATKINEEFLKQLYAFEPTGLEEVLDQGCGIALTFYTGASDKMAVNWLLIMLSIVYTISSTAIYNRY